MNFLRTDTLICSLVCPQPLRKGTWYHVGQKVHLGFSMTSYGKTQMSFSANPICASNSSKYLIWFNIGTRNWLEILSLKKKKKTRNGMSWVYSTHHEPCADNTDRYSLAGLWYPTQKRMRPLLGHQLHKLGLEAFRFRGLQLKSFLLLWVTLAAIEFCSVSQWILTLLNFRVSWWGDGCSAYETVQALLSAWSCRALWGPPRYKSVSIAPISYL